MFTSSKEIRIETSTCCNYNCIMCPRNSFVRKKEIMPYRLFESIILACRKELPEIDSLTISGFGEFATDPGWKEKLELGRHHFSRINILTNLSLIPTEDLPYLADNADSVRISVYGIDEHTYRAVHRQPENISYSGIMRKINELCRNKSSCRIILNFLSVPENCEAWEQWIELWKDKADLLEVWKPHNWVEGKNYRKLSLRRTGSCGRPVSGPVQVQVDGTVNVCCFDYNGELQIGDLKKQSFGEIFKSQAMEVIQQKHRNGNADEIELCRNCDQRNPVETKSMNMLYSSEGSEQTRVEKTSTNYESLDTYKKH